MPFPGRTKLARGPRVEDPCSRASFSRQFLVKQWLDQFLFLLFNSSNNILPSPTHTTTTAFFTLPVHFIRSILLYPSGGCNFCRLFMKTLAVTKHRLFILGFNKDTYIILWWRKFCYNRKFNSYENHIWLLKPWIKKKIPVLNKSKLCSFSKLSVA